jgi:hypothetical protein
MLSYNLKDSAGTADTSCMRARLLNALRRLRSDESGQSLVIMGVAMFMIIGVAALAIDTASWEAKRHQDQVVADASALAAANCLANPTVGPGTASLPLCSSTAAAQQVAVSYAAANGLAITTSEVTVAGGAVTVKAASTSPSYFAKLFGFGSPAESATATAGYTAGASAVCTTALQNAGQCYAIYTQDSGCGSSDGWVTGSASVTITGAVHTQGTINFGSGGGTYNFHGPTTYSSGNCTVTVPQNSTTPYNQVTAGGNQASTYWPIDYSTYFTACSATGTYQCTGPGGTPSYCGTGSNTGSSVSLNYNNTLNGVYCAYGTGTPSNPATWNGGITLNSNSNGSSSAPASVTFIGGYLNATSESNYLQPALDGCLMYLLDSNSQASANSNYAVSLSNGNMSMSGTIFTPNGTMYLNGISLTTGFLEGYSVNSSNLTFTGNGPAVSSTGNSLSGAGSDTLTQ